MQVLVEMMTTFIVFSFNLRYWLMTTETYAIIGTNNNISPVPTKSNVLASLPLSIDGIEVGIDVCPLIQINRKNKKPENPKKLKVFFIFET